MRHEEVSGNDEFVTDMRRTIVHSVTSPGVQLKMQEVVFPKTNLARALPTLRIEQDSLELGFSAHDIRSLFDHTEFPAITFNSNTLCFFHVYARDILDDWFSPKNLATLFEMNERTVHRNLPQGPQEPGTLDSHNSLDA
jgi:hypothetical protein